MNGRDPETYVEPLPLVGECSVDCVVLVSMMLEHCDGVMSIADVEMRAMDKLQAALDDAMAGMLNDAGRQDYYWGVSTGKMFEKPGDWDE